MRRTLLAVTMASAFLSTLLCSGAPAQKRPPVRDSKSVYASASKAVVTILVMDREGQQIATGSGVVVSSNGRIVTNYHLVAGGTFFEVRFASATGIADPAPARPIACLPDRDLAMLGVTPDRRLAFAGQTASLPSVGERVLAIGSPLGLEGTLSEGVVSQLRELDGMPLIQTTAQISPGSSGGGLFLYTGDLAGITTMSLKGGQSLNFAVPVDAFRQLRDCKTFPPLPTPESDRALSPTPTPTPDSCAGLTRLGKALGKINSLNSKGQDEWIAALNRKSRNEPVPDANVYQLQVLAELAPAFALGQDRAFVETKIREWQEVVAKDPTDFDTLTAIGSAYGKLGDYAAAESYFKKSIAVKPSYAEAWSGLGVTYGFLKRPVDAEKALRKALSLDPNDPATRAKLGSTLSKLGRFDEAIPQYRKGISLKPDLADAYLGLGIAYLQKGDRQEAARQVAPLRKLDKDRATELQSLLEQFR